MSAPSKAAEKREKKRLENEAKIENANQILRQVAMNEMTPKNIRREIWKAVGSLNDKKQSLGIRAANTVSSLEGLSRSSNLPSPSRVSIWSAISILESVREA